MAEPSVRGPPPSPYRGEPGREAVVVSGPAGTLANPNHADRLRRLRRSAGGIARPDRACSRRARFFHLAAPAVVSKVVAIIGPGTLRIPWMQTGDLNVPEPTAVRIALERCEDGRLIDGYTVTELFGVAAREI